MKKLLKRIVQIFLPWFFLVLMLLIFRALPAFSSIWMKHIALPFSGLLHRYTSTFPFPLLELAAISIVGYLVLSGIFMLLIRQFLRWLRICLVVLWSVLLIYILLWFPAYWSQDIQDYIEPDGGQLIWLCEQLIEDLNQSDLKFPDAVEVFHAIKNQPSSGTVLKLARYPEWMNRLNIAGIWSPWTGEIIINPETPAAALPFTSVHEIMHLRGIGDEGEANIAAWRHCMVSGGYFADSARLWALRYAMDMLLDMNAAAVSPLYGKMNESLRRTFLQMGGGQIASTSPLPDWIGLSGAVGDYDHLVNYLLELQFSS